MRINNKLNPHMTPSPGIEPRVTLVEGECSHHHANHAPQDDKASIYSILLYIIVINLFRLAKQAPVRLHLSSCAHYVGVNLRKTFRARLHSMFFHVILWLNFDLFDCFLGN